MLFINQTKKWNPSYIFLNIITLFYNKNSG